MKRDVLKSAFTKRHRLLKTLNRMSLPSAPQQVDVPEGLYEKCMKCNATFLQERAVENAFVCPECDNHFRIRAVDRIRMTCDEGSFIEKGYGYITLNPLFQEGYDHKVVTAKKHTQLDEAYVYGYGENHGYPFIIGVMDSHFMMGSMGSVVGEKVTKSVEYALYKKLPLIIFIASGGARMQEGIYSLMQMAKTSGAIRKLHDQGQLYVSILTHPTTGGVTASFAMLGDIILAEPQALIGFAGPRVIEQTIKQSLPEGFQKAEFLKQKGMVDKVVHRHELRDMLHTILKIHARSEA